jgi:hypothetical protein
MDRMVANMIDDIRDRMSRSFLATIADDIIALNSEMGGIIGHGNYSELGDVAIAEPFKQGEETPPAIPNPPIESLRSSGGLFDRA